MERLTGSKDGRVGRRPVATSPGGEPDGGCCSSRRNSHLSASVKTHFLQEEAFPKFGEGLLMASCGRLGFGGAGSSL